MSPSVGEACLCHHLWVGPAYVTICRVRPAYVTICRVRPACVTICGWGLLVSPSVGEVCLCHRLWVRPHLPHSLL